MTRLKFCGMSRPRDIEALNALPVDYAGFVFYPPSRRYVTAERARELRSLLREGIAAVGVFVDEPLETVARLLDEGVIDIAQLHGHESDAYVRELRERTGRKVIRAFCVRSSEDVQLAEQSSADCVLLDAPRFGSGETFDWTLLKAFGRPYFLAGGLTAGNAVQAVRELDPFALDVSSGIETGGVKDPEKMKAFAKAIKEVRV